MSVVVLKLGGSLKSDIERIMSFLADYSQRCRAKLVVIPGGGPFADAVREHARGISDETTHWMAVLAMEQYGRLLADYGGVLVDSLKDLRAADAGLYVVLPFRILKEYDRGILEHSWRVTSDTIAAFIASLLGVRCIIKLTDVDGVFINGELKEVVSASELSGQESCVDEALPEFLMNHRMECLIVNGRFLPRIADAIEGRKNIYTKIVPL
ncbi:MAG: 5--3-furanmethanol-phosphate kinase MfnE [Candidatus Alkanophagales archaeon MCA70_species_2]|nr:5--3-furanmethanol-phosphate kinase MfnE [Candidatus Alkanophaga liquidiphilum]